jgi:hypothetical protein
MHANKMLESSGMSSKYYDEALIHDRIHLAGFSGEQNIFETKMHNMKAKCSEGRKVLLQVGFFTEVCSPRGHFIHNNYNNSVDKNGG